MPKHDDLQSYVATPIGGHGAGIMLLHAWWGLTDFFKTVADRLAKEGFVAMAPDFYKGAQAGTIEEAKRLRSKFNSKETTQKLLLSLDSLENYKPTDSKRGIGALGFSLGGFYALGLSTMSPKIKAVATFYGARKADYSRAKASFIIHLAEEDDYVSDNSVREMKKSFESTGKEFDMYKYEGTKHWFFESDRPEAFNAEAAELAWTRTTNFFRRKLA